MGRKFSIFALFYFIYIRGQIPSTSPQGGLYSEGRFNGGFLRYDFGRLIFGGAYFRNFTVLFFIRTSDSAYHALGSICILSFTPELYFTKGTKLVHHKLF